jgi:FkbM family methyltransferase
VKRVVHAVLKACGYRLLKIDKDAIEGVGELLGAFFTALKKAGFSPRHILDVGANHGLWTREAMVVFPDAQYTLVEPQDELKSNIEDLVQSGRKIEWINAAASDRAGTMAFTIANRDDSSTLSLSAEEARAEGLRQVPMTVRTLNEIVSSSGKPCPDLVKIDAEGFDLKVLAGATELFGKTEVFLVEAAVCCEYPNSVAQVVEYMHGVGYRLMDITDLNRSPKHGVLWLCEMAFVRAGSRLLENVTSYE